MDSGGGGGVSKFRYHRKPPSSHRLLGISSNTQPSTSTSGSVFTAGDELSEHDIFYTSSDVSSDIVHQTTAFASPSTNVNPNQRRSPNHRHSNGHQTHHRHSGILAALPESDSHAALLSVSSSSSASSTSTSSARLIPTAPKRPPLVDRVKFLQSAPVNVPVIPAAAATARRSQNFDDVDDDDYVDNGEMLPPHEVVASRQPPILASSVLEGAGRKLKGRDLRQVRNAIWRHTGFLD